jgi:hypothetical protein
MKKIYKVKVERVTEDWGRFLRYDEEYVMTENIEKVIEEKKAKIENIGQWWMGYGEGEDKRPNVTAEEITVREA